MTISAVATVQGGQVTIPVGNNISDGKKVRVTVVDAEKVVPMIDADVDIEIDEIIVVPVTPVRIGKPVVRYVKDMPSLVGIEE